MLRNELSPTLLINVDTIQEQFDDEARDCDSQVDHIIETKTKLLLDQKEYWV